MIHLVTNRNINGNKTNHEMFGDDLSKVGDSVLRVAIAEKPSANTEWKLDLLSEDGLSEDTPTPLEKVFAQVANDTKPCVFFIHGFNQSLKKNLSKCKEIEAYGVNVIAFSWPSNPGPEFFMYKVKEYRRAQKNARKSAIALERFFEKLDNYVQEIGNSGQIKTLVVHSLGNYLTQAFVSSLGFENQTSVFKNILLHQADVDSKGHEKWVDKIALNSRVIATINETDDTLDASDIINPDRLGNTAYNLNSKYVKYYNFTNVEEANDEHRLWLKYVDHNIWLNDEGGAANNEVISDFFEQIFKGNKVNNSRFQYNSSLNCFEIA